MSDLIRPRRWCRQSIPLRIGDNDAFRYEVLRKGTRERGKNATDTWCFVVGASAGHTDLCFLWCQLFDVLFYLIPANAGYPTVTFRVILYDLLSFPSVSNCARVGAGTLLCLMPCAQDYCNKSAHLEVRSLVLAFRTIHSSEFCNH
jgi:hypothetical protein